DAAVADRARDGGGVHAAEVVDPRGPVDQRGIAHDPSDARVAETVDLRERGEADAPRTERVGGPRRVEAEKVAVDLVHDDPGAVVEPGAGAGVGDGGRARGAAAP